MSNKDYPENESFTIILTDLWYFSMRLKYVIRFLKRLLKPQGCIAMWQKAINLALVAISKIIIMWVASRISYELRTVYTIRWARWYPAGKEWKINNVEVKIITFVIKPGRKFTWTVYDECEIKVPGDPKNHSRLTKHSTIAFCSIT